MEGLEPRWEVDPKKLNLWGGLKNKWTSFLESTFILWITSPIRRFFSPKEKSGGNPKRITQGGFSNEMRNLCKGFHR